MKKLLPLLALCLTLPGDKQEDPVLKLYRVIELTFDSSLTVSANTLNCRNHIWMNESPINSSIRRVDGRWLIHVVPTVDGDALAFLMPNSLDSAKVLGIHSAGIAFWKSIIPFTSGKLALKGFISSGETVEGTFALHGNHPLSGTFIGRVP